MLYDILYEKYGNIKINELNIGCTNKAVIIEGSNHKKLGVFKII
jgi:hypothetical protein